MKELAHDVTHEEFSAGRWKGKWISSPCVVGQKHVETEDHTILFRKRFSVQNEFPKRIPCRFTADSRYILWVNGIEVFRGPVRSQPRRLTYDMIDLAPYLHEGENIVCAQVRYYGEDTAWWMKADANQTLGLHGVMVFEARLGDNDYITSDSTWKSIKSDAWSSVSMRDRTLSTAPLEVFDARRLTQDWGLLDFDDSEWSNAAVVSVKHMGSRLYDSPPTDPYGPLLARPISKLGATEKVGVVHRVHGVHGIPLLDDPVNHVLACLASKQTEVIDSTSAFPVVLQNLDEGMAFVVIVDFGQEVAGTLRLGISAPQGTIVDIAVAEALDDIAAANQHSGMRYIAQGEQDRFESFDPMGLRYAKVCLTNFSGQCTLTSLTVCERLYPIEDRGSFSCSDHRLNAIYEAGVRTVSLTSHDAFIDCPSREQRAWVGDSVVHQMVHFTVNSDWRLAIWNPQLANSPRYDGILHMSVAGDAEVDGGANIPEWSLHWIGSVYNLFRYVGDKDLVASLLPSAERVLRWFVPYRNELGLLTDLPEWLLVDWSTLMLNGTSSMLNAHFALGLWYFAEMAEWLEDFGRAKWARTLWTEIRDNFDVFWDPGRQVYVDNIVAGVPSRAMSQLAQALPICARLVPETRLNGLLRKMIDRNTLVRKSWLADLFTGFSSEELEVTSLQDANTLLLDAIVKGSMNVKVDWEVETQSVAAQPFMRYLVHDAVALAGGANTISELCLDWEKFLDSEGSTFWELWTGGSLCHGWSSTPSRDLIQYTLGVVPASPGFTRARISPRIGHLEWAQGRVPTPSGFISVDVSRTLITVESPIPFEVVLTDGEEFCFPAGRHSLNTALTPKTIFEGGR